MRVVLLVDLWRFLGEDSGVDFDDFPLFVGFPDDFPPFVGFPVGTSVEGAFFRLTLNVLVIFW